MSSSASDFRTSERAKAPAEPVRLVVTFAIAVGVAVIVGRTIFTEQLAALEQCRPACELGAPIITGPWEYVVPGLLLVGVLLAASSLVAGWPISSAQMRK